MTTIEKIKRTTLTVAAVARLKPGRFEDGKFKPGPFRREVLDATPGLYLVIQPSGHKSWALRYKKDGKRFKLTLGTCDTSGRELEGEPAIGGHLTLPAARRLASEIHRQRAQGRDPVAERKQERYRRALVVQDARRTKFALAAQDYIEQQARDKKGNRTWWKIALALGLDFPDDDSVPLLIKGGLAERWKDTPVSEITRRDVIAVADEARVTAIPGRAPRRRGSSGAREREMIIALSGMFKWLLKRDLVTNLPTIVLERPPSGQRDRVLTSDELRRLWAACDDGPFGRVVKILMLTGQRTGEVAGMRWSDLTDDTWTIPADRPGRSRRGMNSDAKNKREHTVPLVPAVRELIRYDHGDHLGDLVFTTNGRTPFSGFAKAKARLDKRLKFDKEWQLRDLRRTVDTGMNELGVEPHIVSAVLNHSDHKRGVAAIYNRARYTEPKRKVLERWAAHLDAVISGREEQTVVELRA